MDLALRGRKALVTGANSGIGKAVAICLGQAGADIGVSDPLGDDDERAVARIVIAGGELDVADDAGSTGRCDR